MTALILAALPVSPFRFVYVDPKGYVRLHGAPNVRSIRRHARQPDLSPNGRCFVYWIENDAPEPYDAMIEHDLATGKERILRRGNFRTPRYVAGGRTIVFTEMLKTWSLLALERTTGKVHVILKPGNGPGERSNSSGSHTGSLFDPVPQTDGTVVIHDMDRVMRVDPSGRIVETNPIQLPYLADSAEPNFIAPAPGQPNRLLLSNLTNDADQRILGTDGFAGALWIVDAKTMKGRRITGRSVYAQNPCWVRDGGAILFQGGPAKGRDGIWSIGPDGTGMRFLVPGTEPSAGMSSTL